METQEFYQKFANIRIRQEKIEQNLKSEILVLGEEQEKNHDELKNMLAVFIDKYEKHVENSCAEIEKLTKQTSFIRWVETHPYLAVTLGVLITVGFMTLGSIIGWTTIIEKIVLKGII